MSGSSAGNVAGAREVAVVERVARRRLVRDGVLGDVVVRRRLLVGDDVRGVVGDDVEEDLHPAVVRGLDEVGEVLVRPEVRVDLGEVGDPVAVVAGGAAGPLTLDRLVLEARREPDRGGAELLDVVDLVEHALEVAAVVVALVARAEAVRVVGVGVEVGGRIPVVVRLRALREAVGHHEVEVLARQRRAQALECLRAGRRRAGAGARGRRRGRGRARRAAGHPQTARAAAGAALAAAHARTQPVPAGGDASRHHEAHGEAPGAVLPRQPHARRPADAQAPAARRPGAAQAEGEPAGAGAPGP